MFNYLFYSMYPLMISFCFLNLIMNLMFFLIFKELLFLKISIFFLILFIVFWFFDLVLETKSGLINLYMKDFLKYSFILFVFSELMFFFSIFWYFFDTSMSQMMEDYDLWTPMNINLINPFSMPLMNTFILLGSGFSITIFYMNLSNNKKDNLSMLITITLAMMFLMIQKMEYNSMSFSFSESVFSSIFFFSTGFHGIHVMFGLFFIIINYIRFFYLDFMKNNMMSMEFSIVYWHFVDVIWLFLFCFVYWWNF